MINWIKAYIDKKVEEEVKDRTLTALADIRIKARSTAEKEATRVINEIIYALINERDVPRTGPPPPPMKEVYEQVGEYVKTHHFHAFRKLRDTESRLLNIRNEALEELSAKIKEEVESEKFIDELVDRIKRKQL